MVEKWSCHSCPSWLCLCPSSPCWAPWRQCNKVLVLEGDTCMYQLLSCVRLFVTPWTVARQAPLSMGFSRQEYWSGLPYPSPEDLPNARTEPWSPALQEDSLQFGLQGSLSSWLLMKVMVRKVILPSRHQFSWLPLDHSHWTLTKPCTSVSLWFFLRSVNFFFFHTLKQSGCRGLHYPCLHAKLLQLCLTLSDSMDCGPPGSSVHGILQARIFE